MNKRIPESELIINTDGTVFHLHIKPEDLADVVILVGDPDRVPLVASFFDWGSVRCNVQARELRTMTGKYNGKEVTVISTGMGTDNIDIVMTELDALANVDFATRRPKRKHRTLKILRIGTSGAIRPEIPLGSYVFSKMSVGFDSVVNWYAEWDKVTDQDMEQAFMKYMDWPERYSTPYFVKASEKLAALFQDISYQGITMSAPGFYGPQGRCVRLKPALDNMVQKMEGFQYGCLNITNIEMESSALAGLAGMLGHEAGTICLIIANRYVQVSNPDYKQLMNDMVRQALDRLTK